MESYVLTHSGISFLVIRANSLDEAKEKLKNHYRAFKFEDIGGAKVKIDDIEYIILRISTIE